MIDPAVCPGKPCTRGIRYPVKGVLEWLVEGMSIGACSGYCPEPPGWKS
ncbi:MAG: DUF433 domain-containing protein [Pseudomonadota bacterium]|nr:DUF433 domain-containing protein [Pseudomonadota bacterium]